MRPATVLLSWPSSTRQLHEIEDCRGRRSPRLADDHVLRDVDETTRQVPRVRGAQRGVGEPLAGPVRRDEVLEHRQALHEVGLDRALDDLALRVRHQAAHAGELADLVERPTRPGVGHHEDRVRLVEGAFIASATSSVASVQMATMRSLRSSSVIRPRSYSRSTFRDLLLVAREDLLLRGGDHDVVLRDRDPGPRCVTERELLIVSSVDATA